MSEVHAAWLPIRVLECTACSRQHAHREVGRLTGGHARFSDNLLPDHHGIALDFQEKR
jgi:hypothetical protein